MLNPFFTPCPTTSPPSAAQRAPPSHYSAQRWLNLRPVLSAIYIKVYADVEREEWKKLVVETCRIFFSYRVKPECLNQYSTPRHDIHRTSPIFPQKATFKQSIKRSRSRLPGLCSSTSSPVGIYLHPSPSHPRPLPRILSLPSRGLQLSSPRSPASHSSQNSDLPFSRNQFSQHPISSTGQVTRINHRAPKPLGDDHTSSHTTLAITMTPPSARLIPSKSGKERRSVFISAARPPHRHVGSPQFVVKFPQRVTLHTKVLKTAVKNTERLNYRPRRVVCS
jgi:hypothetical protein